MMVRQKVGNEGLSVTKNKAQNMYYSWNSGTANAHLVSRSLNSSQQKRSSTINHKYLKIILILLIFDKFRVPQFLAFSYSSHPSQHQSKIVKFNDTFDISTDLAFSMVTVFLFP